MSQIRRFPIRTTVAEARQEWLGRFPDRHLRHHSTAPATLKIERQPIPAERLERIVIRLGFARCHLPVDAALR